MQAKINFIPHSLLEILQRYVNLFWVFWTCLVAHSQNNKINFHKTLMFICMQKSNFIIQFFLEILHFKEPCNLIGWQHWKLEFCRIWDWWWNIKSNIGNHLRLFPWKTNDKIFLKIQKEPIWGTILSLFYPNLGKNEFSWKKELCQFLDIPIIYHCAKNQKKLLSNFWGKHQTDGQTDRQADRQTTVIL